MCVAYGAGCFVQFRLPERPTALLGMSLPPFGLWQSGNLGLDLVRRKDFRQGVHVLPLGWVDDCVRPETMFDLGFEFHVILIRKALKLIDSEGLQNPL